MYSVFVILAVVVAVLLAFIVLIQESKGGGLASSFASSNQIMGVRKTTDMVEKATWTLAALLVVFSICSVFALPRTSHGSDMPPIVNCPFFIKGLPSGFVRIKMTANENSNSRYRICRTGFWRLFR